MCPDPTSPLPAWAQPEKSAPGREMCSNSERPALGCPGPFWTSSRDTPPPRCPPTGLWWIWLVTGFSGTLQVLQSLSPFSLGVMPPPDTHTLGGPMAGCIFFPERVSSGQSPPQWQLRAPLSQTHPCPSRSALSSPLPAPSPGWLPGASPCTPSQGWPCVPPPPFPFCYLLVHTPTSPP